jgi:hypothetical protein
MSYDRRQVIDRVGAAGARGSLVFAVRLRDAIEAVFADAVGPLDKAALPE